MNNCRHGQAQGEVTAVFELAAGHPSLRSWSCSRSPGRVTYSRFADGRTRAFVNDQSVSAQTLRALAGDLGRRSRRARRTRAAGSGDPPFPAHADGGLGSLAQATRAAFAMLRAIEADLARERAGVAKMERRPISRVTPLRMYSPRGPARGGRFARRAPSADDAGRKSRR